MRAVPSYPIVPATCREDELPGGKRWICEGYGAPVRDREGNVLGGVVVTVDVTDREMAKAAREDLLKQVQEKTEEMQSLLYVTSHDLRTPLVNVQGFGRRLSKAAEELAEYCETGEPDLAAVRERALELVRQQIPTCLRYIMSSADRMDAMITGLLRLSRLGHAVLNPGPLDMNQLLAGVLATLKHRAGELQADIEAEALPSCWGDANQVGEIFGNLLDNALKYRSTVRTPRVQIHGELREDRSVYCVADNGLGIRPEYQSKIWGLFSRLEPRGPVSGEGLGLTIVKRLVQRQNGQVWMESQPGEGSRFYVALPRSGQRGQTGSASVG